MSNQIGIEIKGVEFVLRKLKTVAKEYPEAMGAALYQEAEIIMAKSVQYCPVDTAALIMSRYIGRPKADSQGINVVMGYGKKYAIYVHEMSGAVNWTKPGSGSKFLERAIDESRRGFVPRLARRTNANIKAGIGMSVSGSNPETPTR